MIASENRTAHFFLPISQADFSLENHKPYEHFFLYTFNFFAMGKKFIVNLCTVQIYLFQISIYSI